MYMITGARGTGKTVFMTEIAGNLAGKENWIVVDLNPERDLLMGLAAKLAGDRKLAGYMQEEKIDLSLLGLGPKVAGATPVADVEQALEMMLKCLKAHEKRLLVTIDEVTNSKNMRAFASTFQILLRQDLPIFLLLAGLFDDIEQLQNEKTVTFLYRTPKMFMRPLNLSLIAADYREVFKIDQENAMKMTRLTNGYPLAFQVLGYFTWEHSGDYQKALNEYRLYLYEYAYEKMWLELSDKDRRTASGIAKIGGGKVKEIRQMLGMSTNEFNPYRKRLIKKGLLNGEVYGQLEFTLPMFTEFVLDNSFED